MIFTEIENILTSIKNKLIDNEDLRRLVYYNDTDALSKKAPSKKEVADSFITYPLITEENTRTAFIAINYDGTPDLDWDVKESTNIVKISCVCHRDLWEIANEKIRTLEMANIISREVQNQDFGSVGKMILSSVIQVYYTPEIVGYALIYSFVDSTGNDMDEF